jgi:hypothetical protein
MKGICIECAFCFVGNTPNKQHLECHAMSCKKPEANGAHPVAMRVDESKCGQEGKWFEPKPTLRR